MSMTVYQIPASTMEPARMVWMHTAASVRMVLQATAASTDLILAGRCPACMVESAFELLKTTRTHVSVLLHGLVTTVRKKSTSAHHSHAKTMVNVWTQ